MAYLSLYRKYRSQTFGDLIGQDHVVRTLQNGISTGRIAHSYLFTGPRGTGKTSSARLLAKALCCENGPIAEPCNVCDVCVSITEGSCIDVVEMDAASQTGVDDVREKIIQVVEYLPAICRYKVFVIDEVHDLSSKAFDALLKTIEEPPPHMIFVLATTEFNKVPPTIRSRCQKFEFHRASTKDLVQRLQFVAEAEGVSIDPGAVYAIARMADGGFRDALTLLEQAIISSAGTVTLQEIYDQLGLVTEEVTDRILSSMSTGNIKDLTETLAELTRIGRDPRSILESLLFRLAELTRVVFGIESGGDSDATREAVSHELAARIGQRRLLETRSALSEAHKVIRDISLPRLWLESELVRVSQILQEQNASKEVVRVHPQPAPARQSTTQPESREVKQKEPVPVAEHPSPIALAAIESTGDPNLDSGARIWLEALSRLPANAAISMRLSESKVGSFKDGTIEIEVPKRINLEWILDEKVPGRHSLIHNKVKEVTGEDYKLVFVLGKAEARIIEPSAVELPAEGEKLAQMAREVFGS